MKTFLTTYMSFSNPWELFTKLKDRYEVPPEKLKELQPYGGAAAVQIRVCVVLKYWVQTRFNDFDKQVCTLCIFSCWSYQILTVFFLMASIVTA